MGRVLLQLVRLPLIILLLGLRRVLLGRAGERMGNLRGPLGEEVMCHSDSWVKEIAQVERVVSLWRLVGVRRFWRATRMSLC